MRWRLVDVVPCLAQRREDVRRPLRRVTRRDEAAMAHELLRVVQRLQRGMKDVHRASAMRHRAGTIAWQRGDA
jgi:hypothetical protein